ncbi:MAG TPA: ANTAR domain-containing protein [Burkholderiaceae bacterium]|nr:ANTAR domain-containing protein [Burkholderiaceae bacterium]
MSLRVLVVLDMSEPESANADPSLLNACAALGYTVRTASGTDLRLPDIVARFDPDIVMIASESDARDTIEHVVVATRDAPRPIALFTDHDNAAQMRDILRRGVCAYVVPGLSPASMRPVLEVAIARFEVEQELRRELAQSRAQLDERKLLDRAKAVLMRQGLSEDDAHRRLRRMAMDKGLKLTEVAKRVIEVGELFG